MKNLQEFDRMLKLKVFQFTASNLMKFDSLKYIISVNTIFLWIHFFFFSLPKTAFHLYSSFQRLSSITYLPMIHRSVIYPFMCVAKHLSGIEETKQMALRFTKENNHCALIKNYSSSSNWSGASLTTKFRDSLISNFI